MAIIISKKGKSAQKVEKSDFREGYLQKYIYDNPESIPLYDIKEDIRLLVLAREFSTNSGPIDALGIDKEGEIYIVETKLYQNPDKRLVVAQVLDYGASLWRFYNNFDDFIRVIDNEVNNKFGVSFNQRVKNFFNMEDEEVPALIENLKKNLNEGNFKFVILMNKLHSQLKDLIIFINENSRFDIFAVEMEYYKHEDYEIMIPKLFGAEVKKDIGVSSSSMRKKWEEKSFFEDAAKKLKGQELNAVKQLYEFSKKYAENISWGTGATFASFSPKFSKISNAKSLYTVRSNGQLCLNFGWLNDNETTINYRDNFKKKLESKKIFKIPDNYKTHYPVYQTNIWCKKVDDFIEVVRSLIDE